MGRITAMVALCLCCLAGFAQQGTNEPATYTLPIHKLQKLAETEANITIDGQLNESVWATLTPFSQYHVLEPETIAEPPFRTTALLFYTTKGLYIALQAEQPLDTLVERLGPRDEFFRRDRMGFTIDPSGSGLYGYWFDAHLGGSVSDGTVLPERQFNSEWDGAWYSATAKHEKGYSAEFFLPWSMMALPEVEGETRTIGFYTSRTVAHLGELWGWPALPKGASRFMSALQKFEIENFKPRKQFTFYPYASTSYDVIEAEDAYKAGFDVFWRPSSNLQLTGTFNPDFGNVESDEIVVNLTSVETFYPEKRPFFLEGQDIFNTSPRAHIRGRGTPTILVYTRRIGGPPELLPGLDITDQEEFQPSELDAAAKVTGQQGAYRYGVMLAVEDDTRIKGELAGTRTYQIQDGRTFAAARLLYETTSGGGRKGLGWITTLVDHPQGDAVVHGVDGHYLSSGGKWNVDGQLLFSDVADELGRGAFADIKYIPRAGVQHGFAFDYFDEGLEINDFGFMRRNDAMGANYQLELTRSNGMKHLKQRKTRVHLSQEYNAEGRVVRTGAFFDQKREFHNNNFLYTEVNYFPGRWDDLNSEGNGSYKIDPRWQAGAFFSTDEARSLQLGFGYFYLDEDLGGHQNFWEFEANWRPGDHFSASFYTAFRERDEWLLWWNNRDFATFDATLWQPKLELNYFLSAKQEFRLTAQWVGIKADEQQRLEVPVGDGRLTPDLVAANGDRDFTISRLSFQLRYRWELAPLSDLFIVYTRGSDVPSDAYADFNELVHRSWTDRAVDNLVIKLRYRLGS